MLTAVTLKEIEQVFEILADLGVSREAVVIPLKPAHPGSVRLRPDNRVDITLDSDIPLAEFLATVRAHLIEILASPAGAALKRDDD